MPTTLYHATTADFDSFDFKLAGTRRDSAANSALGIWFATTSDWISGFGRRVIEAEIDLGNSYAMTVNTLRQLSSRFDRLGETAPGPGGDDCGARAGAVARWRALREELLAGGYHSVRIEEIDGRVAMHVVLSPESILSAKDMEAGDMKAERGEPAAVPAARRR